MKMAARLSRIHFRCWLERIGIKCRSENSCISKLTSGVFCICSSTLRSFCSRNRHIREPCAGNVRPITGRQSHFKTGYANFKLQQTRNYCYILGRNFHEPVPYSVIVKRYSTLADDAISKHEPVLTSGNFIFYQTKGRTDSNDFEKFKASFLTDFLFKEDFISLEEESLLLGDVQKALKRLKYEYDHWDGVIYGYRELEKSRWEPENRAIIQRIKDEAFDTETTMLPGVHVLDLSKDGYIKPHVDSKFCGRRIAGVSLLSTAIMRLKPKDSKSYSLFVDVLLRPRSLYVMRDYARYELTHEVLPDESSYFGDTKIIRDRRIAVVMREEPTT